MRGANWPVRCAACPPASPPPGASHPLASAPVLRLPAAVRGATGPHPPVWPVVRHRDPRLPGGLLPAGRHGRQEGRLLQGHLPCGERGNYCSTSYALRQCGLWGRVSCSQPGPARLHLLPLIRRPPRPALPQLYPGLPAASPSPAPSPSPSPSPPPAPVDPVVPPVDPVVPPVKPPVDPVMPKPPAKQACDELDIAPATACCQEIADAKKTDAWCEVSCGLLYAALEGPVVCSWAGPGAERSSRPFAPVSSPPCSSPSPPPPPSLPPSLPYLYSSSR